MTANRDISLKVMPGTIHGIIGENGAGKSTLMSILYGFYRADAGTIHIAGRETAIPDSQAAIAAGIGMVFQHFKLVETFTVLENVVLGAESGPWLRPSLAKARRLLVELARDYELNVDPDALVEDIGVGMQQRVEILKALYRQADILILDEPTGVLTPAEADHLFRILRESLRDQGKTIVLITHKLREIMAITDTVSVMRRGEMVGDAPDRRHLVRPRSPSADGRPPDVLLRVEKAPAKPRRAVMLEVERPEPDRRPRGGAPAAEVVSASPSRAGEILGIAGVAGNGQSELLEVLGGHPAGHRDGAVDLKGQASRSDGRGDRGPTPGARRGMAHVPEDRHRARAGDGRSMPNGRTSCFGYHRRAAFSTRPLGCHEPGDAIRDVDARGQASSASTSARPTCDLKTARNFSGGNQQKIVHGARDRARSRTCFWSASPPAAWTSARSSSSISQIVALRDARQGRSCWSRSSSTRSRRSRDRIVVMFDGRRHPASGWPATPTSASWA